MIVDFANQINPRSGNLFVFYNIHETSDEKHEA